MGNTPTGIPVPVQGLQEIRRDQNFISVYANNVQLESNAFDVKMVFGILDQSGATKLPPILAVDQHTSVSISWPEVKLLIFFMQLHLAGYEAENGKVKVPLNAIPPEPPPVLPPQFDNEAGRKGIDLIRKMRAEFVASLNQP
jgi:hypothetical protein